MARSRQIPENRLNIIVPVLGERVRLKRCAEVYPQEFTGRTVCARAGEYTIELYPITRTSPLAIRNATEVIAYYFKREFDHDFPGYEAQDTQDTREIGRAHV